MLQQQQRWALLSLLLYLAARQRDTFLAPPASRLYHTMAAVRRIDEPFLSTTATLAVALAALR